MASRVSSLGRRCGVDLSDGPRTCESPRLRGANDNRHALVELPGRETAMPRRSRCVDPRPPSAIARTPLPAGNLRRWVRSEQLRSVLAFVHGGVADGVQVGFLNYGLVSSTLRWQVCRDLRRRANGDCGESRRSVSVDLEFTPARCLNAVFEGVGDCRPNLEHRQALAGRNRLCHEGS